MYNTNTRRHRYRSLSISCGSSAFRPSTQHLTDKQASHRRRDLPTDCVQTLGITFCVSVSSSIRHTRFDVLRRHRGPLRRRALADESSVTKKTTMFRLDQSSVISFVVTDVGKSSSLNGRNRVPALRSQSGRSSCGCV